MYTYLPRLIEQTDFKEHHEWHHREFSNNESIVLEGDTDKSIYLIEQGTLEVTSSVDLENDRKVSPGIYTLRAGQVFGEFCLFNELPRTASVTARSDGTLIVIDVLKLERYMEKNPDAGYHIMKEIYQTLVERLQQTNKRVENLFAWGLKAHGIDKHL